MNPITWVGVPYGRVLNPYTRDPFTNGLLRVMSIATTETVAYNIFLLSSYFLAGVGMYFLVRRLTRSVGAAAISGFVFAFSPYMLMQGKEHLSLIVIAWIPLVFYLLLRAWKERSLLMGILCAVSFTIMTLFAYHLGLIVGVMLATFGLSVWLLGKPWRSKGRWRIARRYIPALLSIAGLVALIVFAYTRRGSVSNDMTGLYLYSARPWDYFIPHAQGVALGWITKGFITSHLHGGFLVESSLFLGYVPMGLAAYALYGIWKDGRGGAELASDIEDTSPDPTDSEMEGQPELLSDKRIPLAFAACALVCFIFSLPPTAKLFGVKLYFPSYLLHYLVPDVRAYARFGLGVLFSVAIIASYGIARLLKKKNWAEHKTIVVVVISLIVLLEFAIVPPFRSIDTAATTDYYRWLKEQPAKTIVALYPYFYADDFQNYGYYFDQRHHEKKMVNGSEPGTEAERIRQIALDLTDPDTPGVLSMLGVNRVMVIPSLYRAGNHVNYIEPAAFDPALVAAGLRKVKQFSDCLVYEVTAKPTKILPLFTAGAYQAVVYPDGKAWHPGSKEIVVNIRSEFAEPVTADVSFEAAAPSKDGTIQFEVNGVGSARRTLTVWPSEYTIKSVKLNPGSNFLSIHSDSKVSAVTEIPGATEVPAAVMVSDINVATRP